VRVESLTLGADVGTGGTASAGASTEYSELPDEFRALLSRFSFPRRLKSVLPNICTLSGLSLFGMLLDTDRPEDFLDRPKPSIAFSQDGRSADERDRNDDEPDEVVW